MANNEQGQSEGNYLESSGTAMFVHGMAKSIRLGYLSGNICNLYCNYWLFPVKPSLQIQTVPGVLQRNWLIIVKYLKYV